MALFWKKNWGGFWRFSAKKGALSDLELLSTLLTWIFSLKHLIKILILFISWFGLQLLYHLPVDSRRLRVQTCIVQKTMWGPIMLVLHGFHAFNKRYKIYKKLFFLGLIYLAFRPVTLTANFTKTFKGMICHKIRDFMADFRWV